MTSDLTQHARRSTVRLTTTGRKSGRQYAVTVWFVIADTRRVYVQHVRGADANWYRNLLKNPEVGVDFGDGTLPARATAITDPAEIRRVLALFRKKYILSWLFQLLGMTRQAVAAEIAISGTES
jgi:deazaflavin-dependent oxidoreductase (nitroreductase family)